MAGLAAGLGLVTPAQKAFYDSLPTAPDADTVPNVEDDFLRARVDPLLTSLGDDPLGLAHSPILATLEAGDDVAAHTYGWTEFEVNPATKELVVTNWGIAPYSLAELTADPAAITARDQPNPRSAGTAGPACASPAATVRIAGAVAAWRIAACARHHRPLERARDESAAGLLIDPALGPSCSDVLPEPVPRTAPSQIGAARPCEIRANSSNAFRLRQHRGRFIKNLRPGRHSLSARRSTTRQ